MSDDDAPDHGSADREGAEEAHGPSIVWLRDDLRVADNPALHAAVERGEPIVVLYVLDEESDGIRPLGGAARWWLHMSLSRLAESLRELGSDLVLRRGKAADVVDDLVREIGAGAVLWTGATAGPRSRSTPPSRRTSATGGSTSAASRDRCSSSRGR